MSLFRRKKRQLPVSFFAFQDIITALAGSLLIIVLAAAYYKSRAQAAGGVAVGKIGDFKQNKQAIMQLEQQIKLQKYNLDSLLNKYKAAEQNSRQQQIIRKQELAALSLQKEIRSLEKLKLDHQNRLALLTAQIRKANNREQLLLDKAVQNELLTGKLDDIKNTRIFRSKNSRQVLLLECSQKGWFWSSTSMKRKQLGANDPSPQQALNELRSLLKKHAAEKHILVIAVRPSAGDMVQALRMLLMQEYPALQIICEPLEFENSGGLKL